MSTLTFSIRVEEQSKENQWEISLWIVKREQEEQFENSSVSGTSKEDYIGQHRSSSMIDSRIQPLSKKPLRSKIAPWILDWAIEAIEEFLKEEIHYTKPVEISGATTLPAGKEIILFVKSPRSIYE